MTIKTTAWDAAEYLDSPEAIAAYLDTYLEDGTPEELLEAVRTVARAKGMAAVAEASGITRQGLYKIIAGGNPSFENMNAIMKALGVRLAVAA